jgi:hypothetical protein
MSELSELLRRQKEQLQAKVEEFAATTEEHRRAYVDALKQSEAAKEELRRVEIVLNKLEEVTAKSAAKPTIIQAVLEVLKQKPEGMTALEILAEINSRYFDGEIVRTSLSPQLSRLKDRDKKIILRDNRWHLIGEQPTLFTRKS